MSKKLFVLLCVAAIGLGGFGNGVQAQTNSVSDIVSRMKAIAVEMESLTREFQTLSGQLSGSVTATTPAASVAPSGSVLGAATTNLQEAVRFGETNDTVAKVQRLLAADSEIYAYGVDSGFFGPKTEAAIKALQTRFGLNPVGVVGPATSELLLGYFLMYPDGSYPDGVLTSKPLPTGAVQGASTSVTPKPTVSAPTPKPVATIPTSSNDNPAKNITAVISGSTSRVEIEYKDDDAYDDDDFVLNADTEKEVIQDVAFLTILSEAQVREVIEFVDKLASSGGDEEDAETAIDDADDAIKDAEDEIDEADDDGEDVDFSRDLLDEAEDLLKDAEDAFDDEDYDDAIEFAEEAIEKAKDAEDAIGEDKRDQAKVAIEDAEDAINDADDAIDEADDDGDDVDDAKDLLDEAEDALKDAEDAFDDEDYDDAIEFAEEAEDLAKEAEDEL